MANEPNPRRVLVQGMAYGSCEGCVYLNKEAPHVLIRTCLEPDRVQCGADRIFIEDTDEAKAAYAAARLEE